MGAPARRAGPLPNFNGATARSAVERHVECGRRENLDVASMGPPRETRWRAGWNFINAYQFQWLQWGHRANAVERIARRASSTGRSSGFNGATARTRWRDRKPHELHSRSTEASMGPPRERGGEPNKTAARAGARSCFNGATARTRWRVTRRDAKRRLRLGFNGATARTRWRAVTAPNGSDTTSTLQWGHRANAVESSPAARAERSRARASMGPPRERGGELAGVEQARILVYCFNGATARTRWRARRAPCAALTMAEASMGPPRERGGESPARPRCSRRRNCFNGATARTRCAYIAHRDQPSRASGSLVGRVIGAERRGLSRLSCRSWS